MSKTRNTIHKVMEEIIEIDKQFQLYNKFNYQNQWENASIIKEIEYSHGTYQTPVEHYRIFAVGTERIKIKNFLKEIGITFEEKIQSFYHFFVIPKSDSMKELPNDKVNAYMNSVKNEFVNLQNEIDKNKPLRNQLIVDYANKLKMNSGIHLFEKENHNLDKNNLISIVFASDNTLTTIENFLKDKSIKYRIYNTLCEDGHPMSNRCEVLVTPDTYVVMRSMLDKLILSLEKKSGIEKLDNSMFSRKKQAIFPAFSVTHQESKEVASIQYVSKP